MQVGKVKVLLGVAEEIDGATVVPDKDSVSSDGSGDAIDILAC